MSEKIDHKALFEALPVPHLVIKITQDGGYGIADLNKAAVSHFGKSADDVKGKPLEELVGRDAGYFAQRIAEAVQKKKPSTFSFPLVLSSGVRISGFLVTPLEEGKIDGGRYLDITAVPASGEALSLQQERDDAISLLTSVFDVSEVGIVVTDQNRRVIRINDSFVRIYGWSRDEVIGRDIIEFIAPEERELAEKNHEEFLSSGIRSSGEMKLLRQDGSVANTLFTTAALELSQGRRFQVTTVMDITLRKQMELSLRVAKEQADAANQAKSTFLANMSHELRTPLNAILGFSEMMMKETFGPLGNDKYKEYLDDIHLSARHLLEIINEVLDMSKIEAGRVELDEEYIDIAGLIVSVTRMMASRAFSSGLKLEEDVEPDLPPLYADPRLVRQVLINLLGNAVKYSNTNDRIVVSAHRTESGALQFVVADTGIGIPKDKIKEALEPFGQVNPHAEAAKGIHGTGLGLPLARAMVELHGGTLKLESDLGQGTTVTVEFPADRMEKRKRKDDSSPLSSFKARAPQKTTLAGEPK